MLRSAKLIIAIITLNMSLTAFTASAEGPSKKDALDTMKKAAKFMSEEASYRGGYLFSYESDLSDQWGEAPARRSQIWVQGATPQAGEMFIDAYKATGDDYYLHCAEKAANALIYGQHPLGGWHYFIEFDKPGLAEWYEKIFSQYRWGMEEYRHYYGNCTYDDNTTQGATRFLLRLYTTTLDPKYRAPLLKALNFLLISQYPNGGWPQRYPLRHEFVHDGLADYTSYYTMNDNSMRDTMRVLIEAWEKLGDERYLKSAIMGAEFMIASQGPVGQAGWAEQYDMDMNPAWARTHEPKGYMPRQTEQCVNQLMDFYMFTGDRRFLSPIPAAIKWFEDSTIEIQSDGRHRLPRYLEVGANAPIYQHKTEEVNELGYGLYHYDSDPTGVSGGWIFTVIDVKRMKDRYAEVSAITPEDAVESYKARKNSPPRVRNVAPGDAAKLIGSLDDRGAWIVDIGVHDTKLTMKTGDIRRNIQGISTQAFIANMRTLMNYVSAK